VFFENGSGTDKQLELCGFFKSTFERFFENVSPTPAGACRGFTNRCDNTRNFLRIRLDVPNSLMPLSAAGF
jgi:hypothetical protein